MTAWYHIPISLVKGGRVQESLLVADSLFLTGPGALQAHEAFVFMNFMVFMLFDRFRRTNALAHPAVIT